MLYRGVDEADPEGIDKELESADMCDVGEVMRGGEPRVRGEAGCGIVETNFDCAPSLTDPSSGSATLSTATSFVNHVGRLSGCSRSEGDVHFCIISSNAGRCMMSLYALSSSKRDTRRTVTVMMEFSEEEEKGRGGKYGMERRKGLGSPWQSKRVMK
jgi:hypothetical protein